MKRKILNADANPEQEQFEELQDGPGSAGQSGATQGLSDDEEGGSESVRELVEEGQAFEASVISGIENAPLPDDGPIRTREVPEDDVPGEYLNDDERDVDVKNF